jgi:hypothetical protein
MLQNHPKKGSTKRPKYIDNVTNDRRAITGIKDNPKLGGGILAFHL